MPMMNSVIDADGHVFEIDDRGRPMRTRHTVTAGQDSSQTLRVGRFIFLKADIREGWAQKNRGVVIGYLKALVSTYQWLHDNREEALKLLTSITKLDKKYIPKSCETYTKTQIWPRTGEANLKGVQTLARLMEEEGALKKPLPKPEDIVDLSYLEEARRGLAH